MAKRKSMLQPRARSHNQGQFSVRVPRELLDELAAVKQEAAVHGLSLPIAELMTQHLRAIASDARRELARIPAGTEPPSGAGESARMEGLRDE